MKHVTKCHRCGSTDTTLLLVSYVCNVCEPTKSADTKPSAEFHYGWICSAWHYERRASVVGLWSYVYVDRQLARLDNGIGDFVLRIKSRQKLVHGTRVRLVGDETYLNLSPRALNPTDFTDAVACVVEENEGL